MNSDKENNMKKGAHSKSSFKMNAKENPSEEKKHKNIDSERQSEKPMIDPKHQAKKK